MSRIQRTRRFAAQGQTTVEYVVILCVIVTLLVAIALYMSPQLRDLIRNLISRVECALDIGGNCSAPASGISGIGLGSSGSGSGGGSSTSGGASSSAPGSPGTSGPRGGPSSSGGSSTSGATGASGTGGSAGLGGSSSSSTGGQSTSTSSSSSSTSSAVNGNYTGSAFVGNRGGGGTLTIVQSSFTQNGNVISGYLIIASSSGEIREDFVGTVSGNSVSFHGTQLTNINMSNFSTYRPDNFVGTIQPDGSLVGQNSDSWGNFGTFRLSH
jgi:hypothetical protein